MREQELALLVTDVQMPIVDGFELTRKIRSRAELEQLPVILVTSLGSDEDKNKGAEAGADAVGFVFYAMSPRRIEVARAREVASVLPPFVLGEEQRGQMITIVKKLARALDVVGLMNVQFAYRDEALYDGALLGMPYRAVVKSFQVPVWRAIRQSWHGLDDGEREQVQSLCPFLNDAATTQIDTKNSPPATMRPPGSWPRSTRLSARG